MWRLITPTLLLGQITALVSLVSAVIGVLLGSTLQARRDRIKEAKRAEQERIMEAKNAEEEYINSLIRALQGMSKEFEEKRIPHQFGHLLEGLLAPDLKFPLPEGMREKLITIAYDALEADVVLVEKEEWPRLKELIKELQRAAGDLQAFKVSRR